MTTAEPDVGIPNAISTASCDWCQREVPADGGTILARCLICGLLLIGARSGIPGAWRQLVRRAAL